MRNGHCYALIMAGGRGTRFWPRSRRRYAKQVLALHGERTLIQQTVDRLHPLLEPERIWIITNEYLRDEIVRQLPEVPSKQILAEPAQRNTAPCIGLAAHILQSGDPEAVMAVFPADHIVAKPARFIRLVKAAYRTAARGKIAVLGIQPRWPETGYGYIEFPKGVQPGALEPSPVLKFREKPNLTTAKDYLASGRFFWNAGMFFWRAEVYLNALRKHLPATARIIDGLPAFADSSFPRCLSESFPQCDNISVDYAVLEKSENVVGLAADDMGWNDVGSWNAVYELAPQDRQGNALKTAAIAEGSSGNLVDVPGKLTALVGVQNLVVVDTPDALLIVNRECAQQVGDLVKLLEKKKRDDLL